VINFSLAPSFVNVNRTLVEAKSAKFIANSHETDYSALHSAQSLAKSSNYLEVCSKELISKYLEVLAAGLGTHGSARLPSKVKNL
jgi:hypothetical protein